MAGLLDMVNDPNQAFLTQLGMGLLGAGGPSNRPVSFGQAFGSAMAPALQGAQNAQEWQQQEAMKKLQIAQLARKQQEEDRQRDAFDVFAAGLPPEQQRMARVAPQDTIKALIAAQEEQRKANQPRFETVFTPEGREQKAWVTREGITPVGGMKLPPAPMVRVDVGSKQESEEAKAVGSDLGKQYSALQSASLASSSTLAKLNRAESLMKGLDTGALTPIGMKASAFSEALGIKVDPQLPQKQAFEAIANELALRAKQQGETNLMPGAMSEADRNFLVAMAPNLSKTPGANNLLLQTAIRMEKRNIELAKMAREYRARNKTFEGFAEYAQEYAERNPLFADLQKQAKPAGGAKFLGFE